MRDQCEREGLAGARESEDEGLGGRRGMDG
jgi:hypothetical protein